MHHNSHHILVRPDEIVLSSHAMPSRPSTRNRVLQSAHHPPSLKSISAPSRQNLLFNRNLIYFSRRIYFAPSEAPSFSRSRFQLSGSPTYPHDTIPLTTLSALCSASFAGTVTTVGLHGPPNLRCVIHLAPKRGIFTSPSLFSALVFRSSTVLCLPIHPILPRGCCHLQRLHHHILQVPHSPASRCRRWAGLRGSKSAMERLRMTSRDRSRLPEIEGAKTGTKAEPRLVIPSQSRPH
ncbi:hypothetical protein MPTK1_4g12220 [Marchantia polymorpha subsp. ruderalis]|uniref:Uncharacterized protein n=2 Tax=Marchantia polymorpha TaxID=3197 RepID=A0AAF6B935_MARPO|nr:hypothetical protein MARPO_0011s0204 [Marchantia polymorpha]BBN08519.1 hypothetical protein Mp_4g12220 [Marchantia polymorpha subsp. ruderalis]|eukprot:PTQ46553.1 hypothetical protein MARPO_0011s0204 [Marchantia polymorpha]